MNKVNPITLQIINSSMAGIVDEMQASLFRTGYSTAIRESQDASCAILDRFGRLVGQHVCVYFHIGSFPACVEELLRRYPDNIAEGDAFIVNHPHFSGCPHAPDVALITPIFYDGELVGFSGNLAHKPDIGGMVPGSGSGQAREIFQEGLHLPPTKIVSKYRPIFEVEEIIKTNSRTPEILIGDIRAQIGTNRLGERRVKALIDKYGKETLLECFQELFDQSEERVKSEIAKWPDGTAEVEAFLDNDGINLDRRVRLHLRVTKKADSILFDFSNSDPQTLGPVNVTSPMVRAASYYAVIAAIDPSLPNNWGLYRSITVETGKGRVTSPATTAPVNCYNATLRQVVHLAVFAVLKIAGKPSIAEGGTPVCIVIGGRDTKTGSSYVHYEILRAGAGAATGDDGGFTTSIRYATAAITLANIEILESEFDIRLLRFEIIPDSGGAGKFRGGPGYIREYLILDKEARFSSRQDKYVVAPRGMDGGLDGRRGATIVNPGTGREKRLQARIGDVLLLPGDIVRLEVNGGGGLGNPKERERSKVIADLVDGYISEESAHSIYGLATEETKKVRKNLETATV